MPGTGRGLPTSPFEIEATKEIIARRIEAGDIKQSDLDLLKKGYKWMTTASALGSIGMAIPTYLFLRRRRPPVGLGVKMLAAGSMGMLGSFLGFTVGGAAAAMEVNRGLENPQQKLKVFQEIAAEARRATLEHSGAVGAGKSRLPDGRLPTGSQQRQRPINGDPSRQRESIGVETSTSTWDSEASLDRLDMESESARARSMNQDEAMIRSDSGFARSRDGEFTDNSRTDIGREQTGYGTKREEYGADGGSTWDRLRAGTASGGNNDGTYSSTRGVVSTASSSANGGQDQDRTLASIRAGSPTRARLDQSAGTVDRSNPRPFVSGSTPTMAPSDTSKNGQDERSKEQREFDEMLERERRGVGSNDRWA